MRSRILLFFLLLFTVAADAQRDFLNRSGCLIYRLGPDTTAIGNYEMKGYEFSMTVADLTEAVTVSKLKGEFFPNGELKALEGNLYRPGSGGDSQVLSTYKLWYASDSTVIEIRRNNSAPVIRKYPVKIMVANALGGYTLVYMPALLVNFALQGKVDSIASHHIVFNSARDFSIRRLGGGAFLAGSAVMGYFTLEVDKNKELRSVDGIGTSWNIKGTVVPMVNMDSVIAVWVRNDRVRPHRPITNKLDSAIAVINGDTIKIRYSRPSARGRVIFGGVVPYDRYWRTGADAATKLTIGRPLYFDGKELPAGQYSIWTVPSKKGWTLMVNRRADIWGTEYHPEDDVLRVPMSVETLAAPIELLTIQILPADKGGKIEVSWDNLKATAVFGSSTRK